MTPETTGDHLRITENDPRTTEDHPEHYRTSQGDPGTTENHLRITENDPRDNRGSPQDITEHHRVTLGQQRITPAT